ncbi:hypothetical protein BBK36DRAFT_1180260 [Trichoderma citrinoviride]|uniref:Uncharacterized protein n=1 Tax=Trichoderma citrinoviride TaxID=58853 RepID=A0A2T4B344_9HYPO|nr:hypothetical protein BBK36DRAFT_1180260 [Trichoderma citrinoviride]PTB63747.1 hypothetical protein BBK36DRAFT_1180260 [Trichoderma citrinoviride]
MAALQETGQGHEMSDLAPIVVRCHSPFRPMGRSFRPRPLAPIPELPGSSQANSSSSSGGSLAPTTITITGGLPTPSPTPPPEPAPSTTCYVCLAHKEPGLLLRGDPTDPRFPLASRCLDCVDKSPAGLDVGRRYELVSGEELWVCRWCGGAEALAPGWDGVEFHQGRCRREHARALWDHWWTAAVQWVLLCVLGALCFGFFGMVEAVKEDVFVLFLATAFAFVFGFLRSRGGKVYQLPLLMEVNRLTVLAGMLYYVVRAASPDPSIPMEAAASEDAPIDEALEDGSFPVSPNAAAAAILLIAWLLGLRRGGGAGYGVG